MNVAVIIVLVAVYLVIAYFTYGSRVACKLGVDESRPTPAHTMNDGVDYVPTKSPVLMGHHFASIAGAAPIVGPIVAGAFGWGMALIWILLGVVFMGAVHDFAALLVSVRHDAKSIGTVIERNIGLSGKRLFLLFSWSALILVVAVFTNVVAGTFVAKPAVATASALFLVLAIVFGFAVYRTKTPLSVATLIGVLLLATCIWIGIKAPLKITGLSASLASLSTTEAELLDRNGLTPETIFGAKAAASAKESLAEDSPDRPALDALSARLKWVSPTVLWKYVLLAYIVVASVTPVWILLQPRDYLNSFLLYAMLAGAVVGAIIVHPPVQMSSFVISLNPTKLGPIFPLLFVTVACGSISGFHSLVASGTTAKQLDSEKHAKPIGYGAMLIEGLLAVLAVCTIAIFTKAEYAERFASLGTIGVFANGIGHFLEGVGVKLEYGVTFTALAVSAFALTSLDTGARLSRFAFQEFFQSEGQEKPPLLGRNRYIATVVSVVLAGALSLAGGTGVIWPIFGSANQLLAALALLTISVWLAKLGRDNLFTLIPMWIMFAVSICALVLLAYKRLKEKQFVLGSVAVLLLVLGVVLLIQALKKLREVKSEGQQEEAATV